MDSSTGWDDRLKEIEGISGDRRSDRRYGMELDVRWKLIRRRRVLETGKGRTVDLSSGGILIDVGRPLPVGLNVELSIAWPVLLQNVAPMQLIVSGRVVRSTGNLSGIAMAQHEFRTMGISSEARPQNSQGRPPGALLSGPNPTAFGKLR